MFFRFSISESRIPGGLAKDLLELLGALLPGALEILDRGLQREERILQLVRQAPRQFAPRGHALGLHQLLALLGQLRGHAIERARKLADFVAPANVHARAPIPFRHFARPFGQFAHRARHARRAPPTQHQAKKQAHGHNTKREIANAPFELHDFLLRAPDQQYAEQFLLAALQRQRVKCFGARRIGRPGDLECLLAG